MDDLFLKCKNECVDSTETDELKRIEEYLCLQNCDALDTLVSAFDFWRDDCYEHSGNVDLCKTIWAKLAAIINGKPEQTTPASKTAATQKVVDSAPSEATTTATTTTISATTTDVSLLAAPLTSSSCNSAPLTNDSADDNEKELLHAPKNTKFEHFKENVIKPEQESMHRTSSDERRMHTLMAAEKWKPLRAMEELCCLTRTPLTEWLVTGYHLSELPINEYLAQNELFNQVARDESSRLRRSGGMTEKLKDYLSMYEREMAKPLHQYVRPDNEEEKRAIAPFRDSIDIIVQYMNEINLGIKHVLLSQSAAYPIQLDVYFVAPGHPNTEKLNLHALRDLTDVVISDKNSRRQGAVLAVNDIYNLLRRASTTINRKHHQRFVMLVVRQNEEDAADDTVYLYRPNNEFGSVPDKCFSDFCELLYLMNSTSEIVPGLKSTAQGVLGWTQHLHSAQCNKVYLSYGDYKSRVFKADILSRLKLVFDADNDGKHDFRPRAETESKKEFLAHFCDLDDEKYAECGEYWFNNARQYEVFQPKWNDQNCRAKCNVFIPKKCTADLMQYIDEKRHYATDGHLYYKLDYTIGMQVCDRETVAIRFGFDDDDDDTASGGRRRHHRRRLGDNQVIGLINTELHRNGDLLYAVIEGNNQLHSRQKWKIATYSQISEAFMTAAELYREFGVFSLDLPKGSKHKHKDWEAKMNEIEITENLIRATNWNHARVVQSKQNCDKMQQQQKGRCNAVNALCLTEKKFKQLAVKSLQKLKASNEAFLCMARFKFRKNQYHLEKLLPVWIPQVQKYVAISFWYNRACGGAKGSATGGRTQASGVCLDLIDLRNKACLIQRVPQDSWLNPQGSDGVTNLSIGGESSCSASDHDQLQRQQQSSPPTEETRAAATVTSTGGESSTAAAATNEQCNSERGEKLHNTTPKKNKKKKKKKKKQKTAASVDVNHMVHTQTKPVKILKPPPRQSQSTPCRDQTQSVSQALPTYQTPMQHQVYQQAPQHVQQLNVNPHMYDSSAYVMQPARGSKPNASPTTPLPLSIQSIADEVLSTCSSLPPHICNSYDTSAQLPYPYPSYPHQYAHSTASNYSSVSSSMPDYHLPNHQFEYAASSELSVAHSMATNTTNTTNTYANYGQQAYTLLSTPSSFGANMNGVFSAPIPQACYYDTTATSDVSHFQQAQAQQQFIH